MKISEVISQLARYMTTDGDLECFVIVDSITIIDGNPKNSHTFMLSPVQDILCLKDDEKKVTSLAISSVHVGAPAKTSDGFKGFNIAKEKPKEEDKKETEEEIKYASNSCEAMYMDD